MILKCQLEVAQCSHSRFPRVSHTPTPTCLFLINQQPMTLGPVENYVFDTVASRRYRRERYAMGPRLGRWVYEYLV